jgi:hypothetical protein
MLYSLKDTQAPVNHLASPRLTSAVICCVDYKIHIQQPPVINQIQLNIVMFDPVLFS